MTVLDYLKQDLVNNFPSILCNPQVDIDFDDLANVDFKTITNELSALSEIDGVDLVEKKYLIYYLLLADRAEDVFVEYDERMEKEFNDFIQRKPEVKSIHYFKITAKVDHFLEDGFTDKEVIEFYDYVLNYHSELIEVDTFFLESNLLIPILLCEKHPLKLIGVFKDAIKKYPGKAYLKKCLSRIYETNNDFDSALFYAVEFLGQLEDDKIYDEESQSYQYHGDFIEIEDLHLGILSAASLSFQLENYKSTLIYCNKLLYEYNKYPDNIYSFQNLFIDPLVLRLKVYMIQDEEAFRKDFELLKSKVEAEVLLQQEYRSIVEFAKKLNI